MKNLFLLLVLVATAGIANAQGFLGGFFSQQSDKEKDMAEQIALLETYSGMVKSGYKDAQNGLTTMHDLKNGTFNLHSGYFSSLSQVNPQIVSNPKVKAITTLQQQIATSFGNAISWQKSKAILTASEISYMQSVYNNLLEQCDNDLQDLKMVITPGSTQMKDEERLKRIDAIYSDMQDKNAFTQHFTGNMKTMALDRQARKQNNGLLKQLYNN